MTPEQFLILLDNVALPSGLASDASYKLLYARVYYQLQLCAFCGGPCKLDDNRQCEDCRRFEASRREEY